MITCTTTIGRRPEPYHPTIPRASPRPKPFHRGRGMIQSFVRVLWCCAACWCHAWDILVARVTVRQVCCIVLSSPTVFDMVQCRIKEELIASFGISVRQAGQAHHAKRCCPNRSWSSAELRVECKVIVVHKLNFGTVTLLTSAVKDS